MTYYQVIQRAFNAYYRRGEYAYYYGAKGQILTDSTMRALEEAEPEYFKQYTPEQLEDIHRFSRGKIGLDCSGFINLVSGVIGYSTLLYEQSTNKTTPHDGTEGNILYTTFGGTGRHIGLDVGYGYFMDCPKEGETFRFGKIGEYPWEKSGQINGIDYTGAKN